MEAFKPFLQRLSQPIILSFCIAWLIWNWEIVVALIWYDANTIQQLDVKNHTEYIENHKDFMTNYGYPLLIAFAYPLVLLILNSFFTLVKKYEEKLFFKITDNANVPTKLYLDLQDQVDLKEKRISKFIEKESSMLGELNDLKIENQKLKDDISIISNEYKETKIKFDQNLVDSEKAYSQLNRILIHSNPFYIVGNYTFKLKQLDGNAFYQILSGNFDIYLKDENSSDLFISLYTSQFQISGEVKEYIYSVRDNLIKIYTSLDIENQDLKLPNNNDQIYFHNLLNNKKIVFYQSNIKPPLKFEANYSYNDSKFQLSITRNEEDINKKKMKI